MTEPEPAALDVTIAAWVRAHQAATAQITLYTQLRDRAAEQIQAAMGDATEATIGGRPAITWAWSKPGQRLDRAALEADHGPEFVAKYLVENRPARPFKVIYGGDES